MREKGIKQHAQPLQPRQKYHIKERERDHAPGPRPTRRSHTQSWRLLRHCFLSFLPWSKEGERERERAAAAVGRDNVLTKAGGWKFANSGAHA
jgi:hypothetical protein